MNNCIALLTLRLKSLPPPRLGASAVNSFVLPIRSVSRCLRGAIFVILLTLAPVAARAAELEVGCASRDITPEGNMPMWGYGDRHALLSNGVLDPLMAKAVVLAVGDEKVALVGLDLGRGPTIAMMAKIREEIAAQAGIDHVMICGSHTHHGPVIELTDRDGHGKGKFDAAVAYAQKLPGLLIEAIVEADKSRRPARIGVATKNIDYNRNRHTKRTPKVTDPMLAVVRLDDYGGTPIAVMVNFAAHPVMTETMVLKFSADYPGFMQRKVEESLSAPCVFLQGASGDMSPNPGSDRHGPEKFGHALAAQVLELAGSVSTSVPERPSVMGRVDRFAFNSRVDFSSPLLQAAFSAAFFPELVRNFVDEYRNGITAELNTVIINGQIALVGGSGEFFCNHSNRLKERSYIDHTLFLGYCNGHNLYFPTIEAASEGGYGADQTVSPVELGAGEQMMNRALVNIYAMLRKFSDKPALRAKEPAAPVARTTGPAP